MWQTKQKCTNVPMLSLNRLKALINIYTIRTTYPLRKYNIKGNLSSELNK